MYSFVYIMSNTHNTVLYIGVTNNLERRIWEHRSGFNKRCFTYTYNCHKLVNYEVFGDIKYAIQREKQLKKWKRKWKDELIEKNNRDWRDLDITPVIPATRHSGLDPESPNLSRSLGDPGSSPG